MDNKNKLSMKLNPTQLMARSGLMGCAANGDKDARNMLRELTGSEGSRDIIPESAPAKDSLLTEMAVAYGNVAWVRHTVTDLLFKALKMSVFVDLGCGLNHRGIEISRQPGKYYYGIDLPVVIDELRSTMLHLITVAHLDNRVRLLAVDATDYDSLRFAIGGKEPLFIVTEGLMMYLTEKEMITVVDNISKLLGEFGGVWITNDRFSRALNDNVMKTLSADSEEDMSGALNSLLTGNKDNIIFDNSYISLSDEEFGKFMKLHGFNIKTVSVEPYISSLDIPEKIRPAFSGMKYTLATSALSDIRFREYVSKSRFHVESINENGDITISIVGRLDTMTSPELVSEFEKRMGDRFHNSVTMDMTNCSYVSSAGIRALMMIIKKMKQNKGTFSIKNLRPEVYDIIEVTGFYNFI